MQCPRMFYYKYVESFNPRPMSKDKIDYSQRGSLEHQVINSYLKKHDAV